MTIRGNLARTLGLVLGAAVLAGCGSIASTDSLMVDPALYSAYRCNDLVAEAANLDKREKELRNLMDKAREGGGGTLIGELAYRPDYETVRGKEALLERTAAEKRCQLAPSYRSDQTIR